MLRAATALSLAALVILLGACATPQQPTESPPHEMPTFPNPELEQRIRALEDRATPIDHPLGQVAPAAHLFAQRELARLGALDAPDSERVARLEAHLQLLTEVIEDPTAIEGRQISLAFEPGPEPREALDREWPWHYLVFVPPGYSTAAQPWPLLFFLHGSGERGDDIEAVAFHGPPMRVRRDANEWPMVIVSPQSPEDADWDLPFLEALHRDATARFAHDPERVLLTGLSRGGHGAWAWAIEHPERFAALAPICGIGDPARAERIAHLPTWIFHNADDGVVPVTHSDAMAERLEALGAPVRYTRPDAGGHNSWTPAYENPELVQWLLEHRRNGRR